MQDHMKPVIALVGVPGTHTFRAELCEQLNSLTDAFKFEYHSNMQDALMIHCGLYHGTVEEVMARMIEEEAVAPAAYLYIERPQGNCLRNIREDGRWTRDDFFSAKPVFDGWAKFGEQEGLVLTLNPEGEQFGAEAILKLAGIFYKAVMKDHEDFLASKVNPDQSAGETSSKDEI